MHLLKQAPALILLFALFGSSCRSQIVTIEEEHQEVRHRTDSTSEVVEKITKIVTTPPTTAKMNLTQKQIDELPIGAVYEAKDGNASGTVRRTKDNNIEFTANCDSLNLLLESLNREVYRYQKDNKALVTKSKEQKEVGLNSWEYFQIYGFRIYVILTFIYIVYRKWKN